MCVVAPVPYGICAAVAANVPGCSRHCIRSSARCRCFRFALFARGGGPAQVRQAAVTTRGQRPSSSYRHEVKYEAYCRGLRRMSASLRAIPHCPVEVDRHWCRHPRYLALPTTARLLWRHGIFADRGDPGVAQRSTSTDFADATGRLLTGYAAQASPPAKDALQDTRKLIRQRRPGKSLAERYGVGRIGKTKR